MVPYGYSIYSVRFNCLCARVAAARCNAADRKPRLGIGGLKCSCGFKLSTQYPVHTEYVCVLAHMKRIREWYRGCFGNPTMAAKFAELTNDGSSDAG